VRERVVKGIENECVREMRRERVAAASLLRRQPNFSAQRLHIPLALGVRVRCACGNAEVAVSCKALGPRGVLWTGGLC
jgi:hypothetical protein